MSSETKLCPYCAESINVDAIKCKHCGEFLSKETEQIGKEQNNKQAKQSLKNNASLTFLDTLRQKPETIIIANVLLIVHIFCLIKLINNEQDSLNRWFLTATPIKIFMLAIFIDILAIGFLFVMKKWGILLLLAGQALSIYALLEYRGNDANTVMIIAYAFGLILLLLTLPNFKKMDL